MRLIVMVLLAAAMGAAQQDAKLTPEQKSAIEAANQQAVAAQYLARIAELERQVAELRVRIVIAEACSAANLKLAECEVKPDGAIGKKADKE